jgi:hypothetical protein
MRRRLAAISALVLLTLALTATPAVARDDGSSRNDRRISVSGDVVVEKGETVRGPVVAVDGNATIAGTVRDYVIVGDGDLKESLDWGPSLAGAPRSQIVGGDAVAEGRVIARPGARSAATSSRLEPRAA